MAYGGPTAYGVTLTDTAGRLSSESTTGTNPTGELFSYDAMGRAQLNSQCTPQNCGSGTAFPVSYGYDLAGDLLSSTNGTGVTLSYSYNTATRLTMLTSSLNDSNHPGTLVSAVHYNPAGAITSATLGTTGNPINESRTYDTRLRLASISDGSNYSLCIPSHHAVINPTATS